MGANPVDGEEGKLQCPICGGVLWIFNGKKECRNPYCKSPRMNGVSNKRSTRRV